MKNKKILRLSLTLTVLLGGTFAASANEFPVLDCVIEPYEIIEVSSAAEGVIERVYVERNDLVTRGQIVAELESDVEKASLAYAQFNASLSSEIKLRRASLDFDQRNHERVEELYTKNAIPLHHKDEAETDAAKSRWLLTKAEDDKRLAALEYARANAVLKRKTVRSPISGVVIARHKSTGEYVEDQPVVTIAQLHPLRIEVIAPVEMFGTIKNGMRANITPELDATGPLTATVMSVDRVIDGASGTFDVRLEMPNPDYAIPSGLKCEIAFTDAPPDKHYSAPRPDIVQPAPEDLEPVAPLPDPTNSSQLRGAALGATAPSTTFVDNAPQPAVTSPAETAAVTDATDDAPDPVGASHPAFPVLPQAGKDEVPDEDIAGEAPLPVAVAQAPTPKPAESPLLHGDEREPDGAISHDSAILLSIDDPAGSTGNECRLIGPFASAGEADRVASTLRQDAAAVTVIERSENVVHSYILATPPTPDRAARDAIAARIAEHGIDDTALLYKGSLRHRYSFGVFNNATVAKVKQRNLKKLGFDIELLPRSRSEKRIWLEVLASDGALPDFSASATDSNLVTESCDPLDDDHGPSASSIAVAPVE